MKAKRMHKRIPVSSQLLGQAARQEHQGQLSVGNSGTALRAEAQQAGQRAAQQYPNRTTQGQRGQRAAQQAQRGQQGRACLGAKRHVTVRPQQQCWHGHAAAEGPASAFTRRLGERPSRVLAAAEAAAAASATGSRQGQGGISSGSSMCGSSRHVRQSMSVSNGSSSSMHARTAGEAVTGPRAGWDGMHA